MSQAVATQNSVSSLTGLVVPLADRTLLLPNVAVAELIPYRAPPALAGMPDWFLGQVAWRDLSLPLLSFEAASGGTAVAGDGARIAILNALGGRANVKFIALLVQGIPRSLRVTEDLPRTDVPLAALELAAVKVDDAVLRIPDLEGLEQLLADAELI